MMKTAEQTDVDLPMPSNQDVIHLPFGLLGFEQFKDFLWIESPDEAPFRWLQALEDPSLTFLIAPPFEICAEYQPSLSDEDAAFLGLTEPTDALVFGIVTLRSNGRSTINLKGPIILNRFTMRGKQVVLTNASDYPLQFPLPVSD